MIGADGVAGLAGRLGLFWLVPVGSGGEACLLAHRCPPWEVEPYGDRLTCPHGHDAVWDGWRADPSALSPHAAEIVRTSEYDDWPRGRLVGEPDRIVVYADRQFWPQARRLLVIERFALGDVPHVFLPDAHYARARHV